METHQLFHTIHQLSRQLTKQLNETLKPFGLYEAQWAVLFALKTKGSMSQSALCDYLGVEAPPMTRTVQRLIKQGFVQQEAGSDKRVKMISLTKQAECSYAEWERAVLSMNDKLLQLLPKQEQALLHIVLHSWVNHLKGEQHD